MPNRIIRDGILSSERVARLDWAEEVFYRRLLSIVDDFGRHEAVLQLVRSKCYPLLPDSQVSSTDVGRWLHACVRAGLVLAYEVAGKQYLQVNDFRQQQRSASKCPQPISTDINCADMFGYAHLDGVEDGVGVEDEEQRGPVHNLALPYVHNSKPPDPVFQKGDPGPARQAPGVPPDIRAQLQAVTKKMRAA